MSIYLYLCQSTQTFNELSDSHPINLLELTIDHREGRAPSADLLLPANGVIPSQGWAYIASDDRGRIEPIFKGQFVGLAKTIDDHTKRVNLVASVENLEGKCQELVNIFPANQFVESGKLHDHLEFSQNLPCYDRLSSDLQLSNIFQGRKILSLGPEILMNTFKMQITDTPIPAVDVTLIKEWTQVCRGETNLFPHIELQFPQGRICTLSPAGLLASWPKTGQMLGRSGYAVVRSTLELFNPGQTGSLNHYPTKTPEINGHYYRIHWLKGDLTVEWCYRQKRKEILSFQVKHKNQYLNGTQRPSRKLTLRLPKANIETATSVFFETDLGRQAVLDAIKIAQAHLAYSARSIEVTCQIPFTDALDLTLDHQIEIQHTSIPQGRISGKLVSYRLERHFDRAVAYLKVLVATGDTCTASSSFEIIPVSELEGISDAARLTAEQTIDHIRIHNHAFDQIAVLQTSELTNEQATWIDLNLKDMRTHDVLDRHYMINDLMWSAPNQMKGRE